MHAVRMHYTHSPTKYAIETMIICIHHYQETLLWIFLVANNP